VWIEVSLATGAITDAYLRNKFYVPKYEDLRQCNGPCLERFDYLLASPDERTWAEGFELQKRYAYIAILRITKIKHWHMRTIQIISAASTAFCVIGKDNPNSWRERIAR
jgi:hypothetical protein